MNMTKHEIEQAICDGKTFLGIELGSTRIKAVLTGPDYAPVASGEHIWENRYQNGIWTYDLDDVWNLRARRSECERFGPDQESGPSLCGNQHGGSFETRPVVRKIAHLRILIKQKPSAAQAVHHPRPARYST